MAYSWETIGTKVVKDSLHDLGFLA